MAYDDPVHYTKKFVIHTADGDVTLTANEARTVQKYLEDRPRFLKLWDATSKTTTYYDMESAACGFCKVATLTSGKEAGEALPCEDPIPNCPKKPDTPVTPPAGGGD